MRTEQAFQFFKSNQIEDSLQQIYEQVPKGQCSGCTKCCSESVNMFYSEYLNISKSLIASGRYKEKAIASVVYYLKELVEPMKCPMLDANGYCAVYEARPLPCRVFGHLEKSAYEDNYEAIHASNIETAEVLMSEFQIHVPEVLVNRKVEFCEQFKSELTMSADQQEDLVDQLFTLETQFLANGLLHTDELNYSLVQWFAYEWLGEEQASNLRIMASQELSQGKTAIVIEKTLEALETAEFFDNFGF